MDINNLKFDDDFKQLAKEYYLQLAEHEPLLQGIPIIFDEYEYLKNDHPIKDFLRYRIVNQKIELLFEEKFGEDYWYNPNLKKFDCDRCNLAIGLQHILLNEMRIPFKPNGININLMIGGKSIELEPDTMNSFWTSYSNALKMEKRKEWKEFEIAFITQYSNEHQWIDFWDKTDEKAYKKRYIRLQLARYEWLLKDEIFEKLYKVVNYDKLYMDFAGLTHTIGNFVFVPYGYNNERAGYNKFADYWDLSLEGLKKRYGTKWFKEYIETFLLIDYLSNKDISKLMVEPFVEWNLRAPIPNTKPNLDTCVNLINTRIRERGNRLIDIMLLKQSQQHRTSWS